MIASLLMGVWMFIAGFLGAVGASDNTPATAAASWLKIIGGALLLNVGLMLGVVTGTILGSVVDDDPTQIKRL